MNVSNSFHRTSNQVSTDRILESNLYAPTEDGTEVVFDELDSNYFPSDDEIEEMADNLGVNLDIHPEYRSIVVRAIREPLPSRYCYLKTKSNDIYIIDVITQEIQQENPNLAKFRERIKNHDTNLNTKSRVIDSDKETKKPEKRVKWSFKKKKGESIFKEDDKHYENLKKNITFDVKTKLSEIPETSNGKNYNDQRPSKRNKHANENQSVFKSFKDMNARSKEVQPLSITSLKINDPSNVFESSYKNKDKKRQTSNETMQISNHLQSANTKSEKESASEDNCIIKADFNVITRLFERVELLGYRINEIENTIDNNGNEEIGNRIGEQNIIDKNSQRRRSDMVFNDYLLSDISAKKRTSGFRNQLIKKRTTSNYLNSETVEQINKIAENRKANKVLINNRKSLSNKILNNEPSYEIIHDDDNHNEHIDNDSKFFYDVVEPKRVVSPHNHNKEDVEVFYSNNNKNKISGNGNINVQPFNKSNNVLNAEVLRNNRRSSIESSGLLALKNDVKEIKETLHNLFFNPTNAPILNNALSKINEMASKVNDKHEAGQKIESADFVNRNVHDQGNTSKDSEIRVKIENINPNNYGFHYFNESTNLALKHPALKDFFIDKRNAEIVSAPQLIPESSHNFKIKGFHKWVDKVCNEKEKLIAEKETIKNGKNNLNRLISEHNKLKADIHNYQKIYNINAYNSQFANMIEAYKNQQNEIEDSIKKIRIQKSRYTMKKLLLKKLDKLVMDNSNVFKFTNGLEKEFERLFKEYEEVDSISINGSESEDVSGINEDLGGNNDSSNKLEINKIIDCLKKKDDIVSITRIDKDFEGLSIQQKSLKDKITPESANKYTRPVSNESNLKVNYTDTNRAKYNNIRYRDEYDMHNSIEDVNFYARPANINRKRQENHSDNINIYKTNRNVEKANENKTVEDLIEEMRKKYNLKTNNNTSIIDSARRNTDVRVHSSREHNYRTHKNLPLARENHIRRPSSQETLKIQKREFTMNKNYETPTSYFNEMRFELNNIATNLMVKTCK